MRRKSSVKQTPTRRSLATLLATHYAISRRCFSIPLRSTAIASALQTLLTLIFHYDAKEILGQADSHAALSRYAARDALRHLASLLLDSPPLNSDRFRELIDTMKTRLDIRGRELFQTVRLSLAGRAGEGDLDRVILLLDGAAAANFSTPVKSARQRIIEFCSAMD